MAEELPELARRALARISDQERIPIRQLLHADTLPDAVRGMLRMEIERTASDDLRLAFGTAGQTPTPSDVQHGLDELLESAAFSRSDAATLVESAYELAFHYLSKPQDFLRVLFGGVSTTVDLDAGFFRSLSYLQEYSYFEDLIQTWAHGLVNAGVTHVTAIELSEKIYTIDTSVTGTLTADHMGLLLGPLYDLFSTSELQKDVLLTFFLDKRAIPVVRALQEDLRFRMTIAQLVALLREEMARAASSITAVAAPYNSFLDELKQAGIIIGSPTEAALIDQIASRSLST